MKQSQTPCDSLSRESVMSEALIHELKNICSPLGSLVSMRTHQRRFLMERVKGAEAFTLFTSISQASVSLVQPSLSRRRLQASRKRVQTATGWRRDRTSVCSALWRSSVGQNTLSVIYSPSGHARLASNVMNSSFTVRLLKIDKNRFLIPQRTFQEPFFLWCIFVLLLWSSAVLLSTVVSFVWRSAEGSAAGLWRWNLAISCGFFIGNVSRDDLGSGRVSASLQLGSVGALATNRTGMKFEKECSSVLCFAPLHNHAYIIAQ